MKRREHLGVLATMLPGARSVLPALGALAGGGAAQAAPAAPGERVVWPEVPLLDGGHFGAAQAADRAVVVVFWSTTCPFCRNHNRHVQKLHRAARGRALVVLGVARESDAAVVRAYARAQGYEFPITLHTRPLAEALSTRNVIPLTAVVDRQGRLKQVLPGEMFEEDVMELLALAG
ncbi:MAG TPA: TlpA disulfide reductase family protein [Rubrivivax sp.]|nr:TlpA family protein disulfide reductase [Pseudomonadota bacterium]HPP83939.1 TlpA disulfide reductase family protein [Rubrivivax sp.]